MSDLQQDITTPATTAAAAAAGTKNESAAHPPPPATKLHLLVCTVCEHPICDASDILGEKADVNPEFGFAYKFDGMLNICDSSSDDEDDEAKKAVPLTDGYDATQKAPYCYRIQHKSYATLQRKATGSDRAVHYADDNLLISLAEGVISRIQSGQHDDGSAYVSPEDLLLPERMSEVCSDQRVDVVRLKERVSDFGVRHEVLSTQSEYRLASMELPEVATLNDGTSVSSFIQPLSRQTPPTVDAATSAPTTAPTTATSEAGIHFTMSYEDVMSGSAEWFPGYVVHNECFCASCGAPVGYRFVPKPTINWNKSEQPANTTTSTEEDAATTKKSEEDDAEGTDASVVADEDTTTQEQDKKDNDTTKPKSMSEILYGKDDEKRSFVGILLSTVKQREWGVRQFARRTVLSRVHTLFDALSLSRQSKSSWVTMDCLADFALTQLEARVNGVGPSGANFIETVPCALRTIMGRLASTLPVDPAATTHMDMSHRHAQYLSQAERGRVGGATTNTTSRTSAATAGSGGGVVVVGEGGIEEAAPTSAAPPTSSSSSSVTGDAAAATTAATIRWGQDLRSQMVADSLHHFTRIGREPLLFTTMIADFMEQGGSAAVEAAAAAVSGPEDTLIAGILRDTQRQTNAISRLNANRHVPDQPDSSPYLLATAAQLMESTKRHLIDVTVKERIAGYKQQAKLIQQLVDKLKEQNSVLVDLVASQRIKMKANESQTKMFEEIIEAHKTQLATYERHIKYQDELTKTLREQLACSTSEIEEQQKVMKSQNETIKTQNEQMSMLRKICTEVTTETSPIYRRAPLQPACLEGEEEYLPEQIVLRRTAPKTKADQERRDELIARSLERQEKLAYLKNLLKQKEALSASLSCNAPPSQQQQSSSAATGMSTSTRVVSTSTSQTSSAVASPRSDAPSATLPEKKE